MVIKAVAFDFGHTLIDERKDDHIPLESSPIHLMPEVSEVLPSSRCHWQSGRTDAQLPRRSFASGLRGLASDGFLRGL